MHAAPLRAASLALLLALLPLAHGSGSLDATLAEVRVEDRFGDACSHPVAGFCLFYVHDEDDPGNATVDAYQRLDYVGAATDFSTFRRPLGDAWLLPDFALTLRGDDLYVRHTVFHTATTTHGTLPSTGAYRVELTEDDIAVIWPDAEGEEYRYVPFSYNDSGGVMYDQLGPFGGKTDSSTDWFVNDVPRTCRIAHRTECDAPIDAAAGAAPNVEFGFAAGGFQVATDPATLTPPSMSAREAEGAAANFSKLPPLELGDVADDAPAAAGPAPQEDAPADAPRARAPPGEPEPQTPAAVRVQSPPPRAPPVDRVSVVVVAGVATATALLLALGFALYSRFNTRAEALRSETRDALLRLVRERPGVCVADAAEALALSRNAVQHHVRVLERVGLVRVAEERNLRTLYPPGVQVQATPPWLRRNETCLAILRALAESPAGLSRDELHRRFAEVPERTRNHHFKRLLAAGAVVAAESPEGVKTLRLPPRPATEGGAANGVGAA